MSRETPTEPIPRIPREPTWRESWQSRRARRRAEIAQSTDMLTAAKQRAHTQKARRAAASKDAAQRLPASTQALIAFTAFVVLSVSLVIAVVVIGTQIGFYRSQMLVQEVDLSKLGIPRPLDLPTFTPVATEGVVWACTLMAVVLVLLNRPSGMWTRAMWFFASIAALVNAWHAISGEGDILGGAVKGGLSIAGPFIVHLFILWVRHVRTGKTLEQAQTDLAVRWRTVGRFLLALLGVFADHVTHPRVAARAFSLWRLYRGSTYATAWKVAVVERRERERERSFKRSSRRGERSGERSGERLDERSLSTSEHSGEHSGEQLSEHPGERSEASSEHPGERSGEHPSERSSERLGAPFTLQDRLPFIDYERTAEELFARLEEEMSAWNVDVNTTVHSERSPALTWTERSGEQESEHSDERSSESSERSSERSGADKVNAQANAPVDGERSSEHQSERSGEHSGERESERSSGSEQPEVNTPANGPANASGEQVNGPSERSSNRSPETSEHRKTNARRVRTNSGGKRLKQDRVIEHYWSLVNDGTDVNTVSLVGVASDLGIPEGTVRRVWRECVKGKHPDPGA